MSDLGSTRIEIKGGIVLWGGPMDGKEYTTEELMRWGFHHAGPVEFINVLVPEYEKVDEVTGLYGLPYCHETYYKTGLTFDGQLIYRIGVRK